MHPVYALSCFSCVQLFVTLWTIAHQAPLSMGFSMQEHWSGLPFPSHGIFLTQGSNPDPLWLLQCRQILYRWATREAPYIQYGTIKKRLTSDFSTWVLNVGRKVKEEHHQSSKRKSDLWTWHYSRRLQVKTMHEIKNTETWALVKKL